jgi:hypothetical protein
VSDQSAPLKSTVDPGCLPAWEIDELPEPKPFRANNLLKLIGPGLVLAGGSIGTGEWVMGPQAAAQYRGALFIVVLLSIVAQVIFNTEVMRYTLCTGEPIMTGFMRSKPGPKFWIIFYLLLDVGTWFPTLAGLAAQILVVAVQGLSPHDNISQETVRYVSYGVFLICGFLALFGRKVYNILQITMGAKVLVLLFYTFFCCVFYVSAHTWMQIWGGLIDPTRLPRDASGNVSVDWALISALAGYAGVGGLGNMMASNFVREKGWGMGGKVGAIPSAFGGRNITLSHIGTICAGGEETRRRFKGWFKYLIADQYLVWAVGSLFGMMLPSLMGAEYLNTKSLSVQDTWRWAAAMAQDFGAVHGPIFRMMTLICGLVIMIPGQFYVVDNIARRWTDALWSGSKRARKMDSHKIKNVYYSFAGAYLVWGVAAYTFFPKLSATDMMKIAGSLANLAIACTIFQTIHVNRRFLPAEVRPSIWKEAAMFISGIFFLVMFGLVVNQKIVPLVLKTFNH